MLELFARVTGSGGGTGEAGLFNGLRVRMVRSCLGNKVIVVVTITSRTLSVQEPKDYRNKHAGCWMEKGHFRGKDALFWLAGLFWDQQLFGTLSWR